MSLRGQALFLGLVGVASCTMPPDQPATLRGGNLQVPRHELRLATDPAEVLAAARALMEADPVAALATVDADGRPRVRSVRVFLDPADPSHPASGFTVWVMTRLTTRKILQIRTNPLATLYFNDDQRESYATIMGTAIVHTDPEHPGARRHHEQVDRAFFWPDFPRDFVMLEIRPAWVEFIGPEAANDERTWRPQAVVFD